MPIINKIKMLGHGGYNKYKLCSSISDLKVINKWFTNDFFNDIKSYMNGRFYCVGIDENSIIVYSDEVNENESDEIVGIIGGRLKSDINVIVRSLQSLIDMLRNELIDLLGEGNFELTFDNDAQKITIGLASTVEHLREQVDSLIARVVPNNLEFEVDDFPIDFERVEYLESTKSQFMFIPIEFDWAASIMSCDFSYLSLSQNQHICVISANGGSPYSALRTLNNPSAVEYKLLYWSEAQHLNIDEFALREKHNIAIDFSNGKIYSDGELKISIAKRAGVLQGAISLFAHAWIGSSGNISFTDRTNGRIFHFSISEHEKAFVDFIPALDPTGCPCMFDTVTRKPFYNYGTGNFLYPTNEAPVMTLDLDWDAKSYAKRTEHGVRRLYHVPKGYTGSKDEYASENGFKELVEPPMPTEGYWIPEWHETDTQLILVWKETEPINTEEYE